LIVILSVMNGLENELRAQLVALSAHARVVPRTADARTEIEQGAPPSEADWQNVERIVQAGEGVEGVARYVEMQALAVRTPEMLPMVLSGMQPSEEGSVTDLVRSMARGHLGDLVRGSDRVVVGGLVAERLGLDVGDPITVWIPAVSAEGAPAPRLRELTVAGVFDIGRAE